MKFFIVSEAGVSCDPARQGIDNLGSLVKELANSRKSVPGVSTSKLQAVGEDATVVLVNLRPEKGRIIRIDPGFNKAKGAQELSRFCVPFNEGEQRRRHSAWFFSLEPGTHLQFEEVEQLDGHLGESTRLYSIRVVADGTIQFDSIELSNIDLTEQPVLSELRCPDESVLLSCSPNSRAALPSIKRVGNRFHPLDCICSLGDKEAGDELLLLCIHEK